MKGYRFHFGKERKPGDCIEEAAVARMSQEHSFTDIKTIYDQKWPHLLGNRKWEKFISSRLLFLTHISS